MPEHTHKVCILDGAGSHDVKIWFLNYVSPNTVFTTTPRSADLVVFTGGSDVAPARYGEDNKYSSTDPVRDQREAEIFRLCQKNNIPMLGICRGSQFLHTMMDGSLWQHVDGHCCTHDIFDIESGTVIKDTTSTHHQMVRMKWSTLASAEAFEFIAIPYGPAERSLFYFDQGGKQPRPLWEIEAYRYNGHTSIMGIQGHPEWGGEEFATWAANKVKAWWNEVYWNNPFTQTDIQ